MSPTKKLVLALVVACLSSGFAAALDFESAGELRAGLEERFALLPLSDGLLLQPLEHGSGPRAIEVSGSGVALDGQLVGEDELRVRLGDDVAQMVLAVAALDSAERQALPTVEIPSEEAAELAMDEEAVAVDEAQATVEAELERAERDAEKAERARRAKKHKYRRTGDSEVAFGSSVTVDRDEVTEDVVVMAGLLKVEGRVEGDATVMGGSATIEGEVTGDVTAIGGPVRLADGSYVHGDVTSVGGRVFRDEGARVGGRVEQVPFSADLSFGPWTHWRDWKDHDRSFDFNVSPWRWWTGLGWTLVKLLFLAGLAWLSLLLAPGPIDRMERRIETEPWKTGLVGLLAQVLFFPMLIMLAFFLLISIIGIPLLLILPFALLALVIVGWFGFVAVAGRVGGWARERFDWHLGSPYWVVLLGLGLIASLSIVGDLLDFGVAPMRFIAGMFMFFGAIVSWAAWTIGFGAAVLTRFGTADSWDRAEEAVAGLPPVPSFAESATDDGDVDVEEGGDEPAASEQDEE